MNTWRMILSGANDGRFNMALDEALLISCRQDLSSPVLRLYRWNPPAVSIGYSQSAQKAVDIRKCRRQGVDLVRRITGGRAVLHREEITYSVCASSSSFPELGDNVGETYRRLSLALLESLRILGVEADWVRPSTETKPLPLSAGGCTPCFLSNSRYELTVEGKKLVGSAQRRFSVRSGERVRHSFIQHGSIPTGEGDHGLASLLPDEDLTWQIQQSLSEKSTHLRAVLGREVSTEDMGRAMKQGFERCFDCRLQESRLRQSEIQAARVLSREKYASDRWNLRR
jgi:lipoate-protein ligase A